MSARTALFVLIACVFSLAGSVSAQIPSSTSTGTGVTPSDSPALSAAPAKVDVKPVAQDEEIRGRLQNVLDATKWFTSPQVQVKEGVVFLEGQAPSAQLKTWAGDLARNTQDVVAVVNRMEVAVPSMWDFSPAWAGLSVLWRDFIRSLPFLGFGLVILILSVGAAWLATRSARGLLHRRVQAKLLRNVIAGAIGRLFFFSASTSCSESRD